MADLLDFYEIQLKKLFKILFFDKSAFILALEKVEQIIFRFLKVCILEISNTKSYSHFINGGK